MNNKDTYLADYDDLSNRSVDEKIDWLHKRVAKIFVTPVQRFISSDNHDLAIGVMTLICCAIEALGHFKNGRIDKNKFKGSDKEDFQEFICKYTPKASTISDELYEHFRCGLAHAFVIEKGGIEGEIEGLYKKEKRKETFYEINPWKLFKLLENGIEKYFKDLRDQQRTQLRENFLNRFDYSFKFWIENPPSMKKQLVSKIRK